MKLSEIKQHLQNVSEVTFMKPNGKEIPKHFHITEVGQINKRFIDCGGTVRNENVIAMQLWESVDFWHRLQPDRLLQIIELSETKLGIEDHEIEIEYQMDTIGKFSIEFDGKNFILQSKSTACLALDQCGIPVLETIKEKIQSCCTPSSGCC
jgi:hypothetical protein